MLDLHHHAEPCHRCNATCWEWIGDFTPVKGSPEDVVACAFCGLRVRVKQSKRQVFGGSDWRFQYGRFKGMTLAEADAEPNGRRYLEILRDSNEKLRDRIASYIAESGLDSRREPVEIVAASQQPEATECPASQASSQRLFG